MPEVAGYAGTGADHFAVPALVIDATQAASALTIGVMPPNRPPIGVMAERLFDIAACLEWMHQERTRPLKISERITASTFFPFEVAARQLGAMATHSIACIRTLWDELVRFLDNYVAYKRGCLPDSFRKLSDAPAKYEQLLPVSVIEAVVRSRDDFLLCRKLRDGIFHNGFSTSSRFASDRVPLVHIATSKKEQIQIDGTELTALQSFDAIENVRVEDSMEWYDATEIIGKLLRSWLRCLASTTGSIDDKISDLKTSAPKESRGLLWGFHMPAVVRLAEVTGNGSRGQGWWYVWPCSSDCVGALGGCRLPKGATPATVIENDRARSEASSA